VDLLWLDGLFALKRNAGARPALEVAVIGIDEASVSAFPEPLALWHRHLASVLEGLAAAHPKAVGLDVVLPERSMDAVSPGADAALVRGILLLRRACPLVIPLSLDAGGRVRPLNPPFLAAAGGQGTGLVMWPVDADGSVRRHELLSAGGKVTIPTLVGRLCSRLGAPVRAGYLDFTQGGPCDYVPFHQVAAWARQGDVAALQAAFEGRVVVVGSVLPFEDRHPTPVRLASWEPGSRHTPGVLLHVQAIRTFLGKGPIQGVPAWLIGALALGALAGGWASARRPLWGLTFLTTLAILVVGSSWFLLGRGWFLPAGSLLFGGFAGWAGRTLMEAMARLQERNNLRALFAGHASPSVLQAMLAGRLKPDLQGERLRVCVLFADLRDFTTRCESANPMDIFALLNRHFEAMTHVLHGHGGTVVQFVGDGLMAVFGAPDPLAHPTVPAFEAAQDMLCALRELNAQIAAEGMPALRMGMGLHVGPAAAGHLGSGSRHQYSIIGDTVNIAARLEGLCNGEGFPLLLSQAAVAELADPEAFQALGVRPLKGHSPMAIFGWPRLAVLPYHGENQ
jgi:class 3 adenylate cyclase/CHASE2 domain-containing sensor protein